MRDMFPRWSLAVLVAVSSLCFSGCDGDAPRAEVESTTPAVDPGPNGLKLIFTYGSEKEEWIENVTRAFNEGDHRTADGKRIVVEAIPMGSGESITELVEGHREAHLTSPASAAFIQLGNAESRARTGKDLVGPTENLVLSPVVIAMWKPMAEALGWGKKPIGWADILALARNPEGWAAYGHPEWGAFKLGHTHPEYSNSGLIAVLAEIYAGTGKTAGLSVADVTDVKTSDFLAGIEQAIVHYGRSTGFFGKKLMANGPGYMSAAVLYESIVIESTNAEQRLAFPLVAVYPKEGTFWSDHPVGIVDREWVTPELREAAEIYIAYLLETPQQAKALTYGFRPANLDVPLGAPIDAAHGVNPKEPTSTLEMPSVEVVNAALDAWKANKKRSDVALVLDVSGSMNSDGKIVDARGGALELINLLGDNDRFSLLPFNQDARWAFQNVELATGRARAETAVGGVFANGGTALYDAINAAFDAQMARREAGDRRILAIVVLSDGTDTDSRMGLEELLEKIRYDSETQPVRVFTIGYGRDAQSKVLEEIADATQAKYYEGDQENIRSVFKDISTFF